MYAKVYVEITNICNMNCSFCHGHSRAPGRMTAEQFDQVLDQLEGQRDRRKMRMSSIWLGWRILQRRRPGRELSWCCDSGTGDTMAAAMTGPSPTSGSGWKASGQKTPAASSAMGRWCHAAWTVRASLISEIYWMEAVRRWRIFCLHHGRRPW